MEINKQEQYTKERFDNAIGTKGTFLSNFHQLTTPIIDEFRNLYYNSEGYYMALRTNNLDIKKEISNMSISGGSFSRKARLKYDLDMNEENRVKYMIIAINAKFTFNAGLKVLLLKTKPLEIIEKNWWKDTLFGVNDKTLQGANILGKCLMEYRNNN